MMQSNGPKTLLRAHFERTRELDPVIQMQELVDHLEHPQVIQAELVEAVKAVESAGLPDDLGPGQSGQEPGADEIVLLEHFHARREITVRAEEPFVFTCVHGRFDPVSPWRASGDHGTAEQDDPEGDDGFDYVGLIQDRERIGALGVVQAAPGDTPYLLLMRGLAGLAELLPDDHAHRLNHGLFKGALGDQPVLELHLVVWSSASDAMDSTLGQLTRDLADVIVSSLAGQTDFVADVGSIACFTMDPENFQGELELAWRV
jgi:hypothetical protein